MLYFALVKQNLNIFPFKQHCKGLTYSNLTTVKDADNIERCRNWKESCFIV